MTKLSQALRRLVRERADNRCEYCLSPQSLVMGQLQVDHILPVVAGGENTDENLCLACELCNQHKWTQMQAVDPETGVTVALFNPRTQRWQEHFVWSDDGVRIVGRTPNGRATVDALRMNNELALLVRRNWVLAGWHPPT